MMPSDRPLRLLSRLSLLLLMPLIGCTSKTTHKDFSSKDAGEIISQLGKLPDATRDVKQMQALYASSVKVTKEQQAAMAKVSFHRMTDEPKVEGDKATLDVTIIDAQGTEKPVQWTFVREKEAWKLEKTPTQ